VLFGRIEGGPGGERVAVALLRPGEQVSGARIARIVC